VAGFLRGGAAAVILVAARLRRSFSSARTGCPVDLSAEFRGGSYIHGFYSVTGAQTRFHQ